ncbi:hypothetical protein [Spirosoma validum]|uniref:Tandem-95 repeat protein n=1 Tax=Spirosoma validum TaxID=2771355 RepID=A0A927B050_9BACT|nr:hypothetical protein [Spirosoma validum]MBD2752970.1 hypothetical protein [Spirosoma validum]
MKSNLYLRLIFALLARENQFLQKKRWPTYCLVLSMLLFSIRSVSAQSCTTDDPYDHLISSYHTTIAKRTDGTFAIWGERAAPNGNDHKLVATVISPANGYTYSGTILKATTGSGGNGPTQHFILTTNNQIYVWGEEGVVVNSSLTSSEAIAPFALPTGVVATDVKIMTATFGALAILTNSGNVYVMGAKGTLYGDGTSSSNTAWHHVTTTATGNPFLTGVTQLRISPRGTLAITSDNNWYTWGDAIRLGTGGATSSTRATLMTTKPAAFASASDIKMIDVSSGVASSSSNGVAYYVLHNTLRLIYVLGENEDGNLGIGSTTDQNTWVNVRNAANTANLTDVIAISAQDADEDQNAAGAVLANGTLLEWGSNDGSMIGQLSSVSVATLPRVPRGFTQGTDKALLLEVGGHTSVYVKDGTQAYCYVGHHNDGSQGDNDGSDFNVDTYNCSAVSSIVICAGAQALDVTLNGTVWNDADGNLTLNGSETGTNAGGPLYVNLVASNGTVIGSSLVSATGTYSFSSVPGNTSGLKLVLTNTASSTAVGGLPTGWVNTGEVAGTNNTATQSTTLGQIELTTSTSAVTGANFGIEQLPTPGNGTATAINAQGSSPVTVPPSAFTSTAPSTDTAPGSVTAIRITTFPSNVTSLTINGAVYTSASPQFTGGTPTGVIVPTNGSGAPTVPILVDPTTDANPVTFTFVAVDNAGKESTTSGTAVINSTLVTTLAGQVWNDTDGNGSLNGLETGTNASGSLYVNVVNAANTVIASTTVAADGSYGFSGLPTNVTGYKLVLTNSATSTTPGTLPTGWVNTGESVGATNTATQTTTVGQIELTIGTSAITAQNFGIEQLPTPGSGSATVANAGGTTPVTVPPSAFTSTSPSTDTAPGSVTAIRITAFPSNTTSLTVNGSVYNSGNFPGGGVVVPTDGSGRPTVPVAVDPTNDTNPVVIAFVAVDNAGKESTSTGTATINSSLVATVSGTVWNDADGSITLNGTETGTNTGTTLYVNLVDGAGTVVGSTTVAADGTYTLANVPTNVTGYKLVLSTSPGSATAGPLPTGWVSTGENVGSGNTAPQSTTLGQIELTMGSSSIAAQNFGIEVLPTPGSGANTVANAGGTSPVTIPANTFTNTTPSTDTAPGSVTAIHITAFPGNVTSLTVNGTSYTAGTFPGSGVTIPTDGSGNPTVPIQVDPTNDANPVVITFLAVDNAGKESSTSGTATINSSPVITVSGSVWNDADGNLALNGSETGTNTGTTLYVNLVDGTGSVVGSTTVASDGSYTLANVPTNVTGYKLVVSTSPGSTTAGPLPAGWVNTGENVNPSNTATQSTALGQIELNTGTSAVTAQNFGIERLPTAGSGSNTASNAGGTSPVSVPANTFSNGTPSADTAPGSVTAIRITTFPGNVTSLTINGSGYTTGTFPMGGVVVPTDGSGNPTVPILVDPTNDANSVVIPFTAIDNAGKESANTGTATLNSSLVTSVSGTVWHDADGNLALNGSETGTNTGGTLYVNLVDGSGTVVGSTTVASNGTYNLINVPTNVTGYKLVVSTSPTSATAGPLPTGWVNTGESVGAGNTAPQSATLGQIELTVGTSAITAQNFGIEHLPTAGSGTTTVSNAGGTSPVTVPPTAFTSTTPSTDTAPGSVTAIRITSFPGNVTSLTINGSVYNAGNFPGSGVVIPTNGSGAPTVPVLVDPTNDANPVVIPFVAIDNAGKESTTTGTATINSSPLVSLSGSVFDDANGLNDNVVSGTAVNGPTLPVYVSLVQGGSSVATVPVQANGTYSFSSVSPGTYSLIITTSAAGASTPSLPTNWTAVGEHLGTGAGSDGTPNGILAVTVTATTTDANFGIDRLPSASPVSQTYVNPGGTVEVQVPTLAGSDPEDGSLGTGNTFVIHSVPASGTLYYLGTPILATDVTGSGLVINGYDPAELTYDPVDGPGSYTFAYSSVDAAGIASTTATATMIFSVVPDLTPIIYARPSTVYNTTDMTVVVDVLELLGVPTSGLITVRVTKDAKMPLIFPSTATSIGGRSVSNSAWTFDANINPGYYTLTTTNVVAAGDKLSFGFTGTLTPGATTGVLTMSSVILGTSGGEVRVNNNVDADKIDYFQQ